MKSSLLLSLLALSAAHPASRTFHKNAAKYDEITDLNNQLHNAAYRNEFKDILTDYVLNEYKDLTYTEQEKVQTIIEELLENIARDFRIVLNNGDMDTEDMMTRIGNPTFDRIHRYIVLGIPIIDECNALKLTYTLENNLMYTRQKIDKVIKDSKIALIINS